MKKTDSLKEIVIKKKERILLAKQNLPEEQIKSQLAALPATRPFIEAINKPKAITLIAEIKKQSPSAGVLRENFDPLEIAKSYQQAGAQAISVLTEEDFFAGALSFLNLIKAEVSLPLLRKDFILEPYQVYESRFYGADAILLIADILSKDALSELIALADTLGMDCLVEGHDEKEIKKILSLKVAPTEIPGAKAPLKPAAKTKARKSVEFVLGINNRDLHTLETDTKTTEKLYPLVPKDRVVVVESGLKTYQDILFLKILGVNAILAGESLLKAPNLDVAVQDLMGW
ncbi:MAG: indole-3-glycerol phosphate synthase TrpC [Candidatus Omnitrophica bacterium]|nr:indole-3-glycerol phosphate synthase TrpC [Candidatus Omnitrophota bacterium]